jgi:hypothetical protein
MLASSVPRIDYWLYGGLDGASSGGRGTLGSVDMGCRTHDVLSKEQKGLSFLRTNVGGLCAHTRQLERATAFNSQCGSEAQAVSCPSEAAMNWWTSRCGLSLRTLSSRRSPRTRRDRTRSGNEDQRFPTSSVTLIICTLRL